MILDAPTCPRCSSNLAHHATGTFEAWVCPSGDGLALVPAVELDGDTAEILEQIWARARVAVAAGDARRSPVTGAPMASVRVGWAATAVERRSVVVAGSDGTTRSVWLDVDVWNRVLWVDESELPAAPTDSRLAVDAASASRAGTALIRRIAEHEVVGFLVGGLAQPVPEPAPARPLKSAGGRRRATASSAR